jgi:hypothetical protein
VVLRRGPGAQIDDENDRIGFGHRLSRLLGHLLDDAGGAVRLESSGVDDDELATADAAVAVVAVACQPGEVGDDGITAAGHTVEQGRLADVRTADHRDDGFHGQDLGESGVDATARSKSAGAKGEHAARSCDREQGAAGDHRRHGDAAAVGG